jgi:hypothetical protein
VCNDQAQKHKLLVTELQLQAEWEETDFHEIARANQIIDPQMHRSQPEHCEACVSQR